MKRVYTAFQFGSYTSSADDVLNVTLDADMYNENLRGPRSIIEDKVQGVDAPYFFYVDDQPLEFEVNFAFEGKSKAEIKTMMRTLITPRNYVELSFGDIVNSSYVRRSPVYKVIFNDDPELSFIGKTVGGVLKYDGYFTLQARCDRPYGYEKVGDFNLTLPRLFHDSPSDLEITPNITITATEELNNVVVKNDLYAFYNASSGQLSPQPQGFFFKSDGTKVFTVDDNANSIFEYSLSTPWDITTLNTTPNHQIDVSGEDGNKRGIFISPDGTKVYTIGNVTRKIYQYTLDIPWDLSSFTTAPIASATTFLSGKTYQGVFFSPDLNRVYVLQSTDEIIYVYNVSSGDITIPFGSIVAQISVGNEEPTPTGLFIGDNGNRLYIVGGGTGDASTKFIHEYNLDTPYGTVATYTNNKVVVQSINTTCVQFKPNGRKMFLIGFTSDIMDEYILPIEWSLENKILSQVSFKKILQNETITISGNLLTINSNLEPSTIYARWNRDSLKILPGINKLEFEPTSNITVKINYQAPVFIKE